MVCVVFCLFVCLFVFCFCFVLLVVFVLFLFLLATLNADNIIYLRVHCVCYVCLAL